MKTMQNNKTMKKRPGSVVVDVIRHGENKVIKGTKMDCYYTQAVFEEFADNKLSLLKQLEIEKHLSDCEACSKIYNKERKWRQFLRLARFPDWQKLGATNENYTHFRQSRFRRTS